MSTLNTMEDQLDPIQKVELALLRAEYQNRHAASIAFVKQQVGEGVTYENSAVRVVVSERGAYYELKDMPEEFFGIAADDDDEPNLVRAFVTQGEALEMIFRVNDAIERVTSENTRLFTMMVLYTRSGIIDRKNCFIYHYQNDHSGKAPVPTVVGFYNPVRMPLFYKIRMEGALAQEVLGVSRCVVFCMANAGDRHLMVTLPLTGPMTDLTALPEPKIVN